MECWSTGVLGVMSPPDLPITPALHHSITPTLVRSSGFHYRRSSFMHGTMKAARSARFRAHPRWQKRNYPRRGRADPRSRYRRGAGSRAARRSQSRRSAHARRRRAIQPGGGRCSGSADDHRPRRSGGEIFEVGPDVENVRVGDRVVVICSITCGFLKILPH